MNALVSILIPCYNAEQWLAECVESCLAQTWSNIEVIIVDDGSTDASLSLARSLQSSRVNVIAQANGGASTARNQALRAAQGDYIQYLDADDLLSPDKITAQVQLLQDAPECLSLSGTVHFFDGSDRTQGRLETGGLFFSDSDDPAAWLVRLLGGDGQGAMVHPAAWLIPRAIADRAGEWDEALSLDDDGEYFARVVLHSQGIRYCPTGVSYYRKYRNGRSLSGSASERHHWSALRAIDLKAEHLLAATDCPKAKRALARLYMERAVQAYPDYPHITNTAVQRVQNWGVKPDLPSFGGWRGEWLKRLFGWKAARKLSVSYHRWSQERSWTFR
jgi:glycosyltransferase involved in cell wall biosynthesis